MIDTHCHAPLHNTAKEMPALLSEYSRHGFTGIVLNGTCSADAKINLRLRKTESSILATGVGLHPYQIRSLSAEAERAELAEIKSLLPKADFLGEVGLDFRDGGPSLKERQIEILQAQLAMAAEEKKPVVLHCVKAHQELLALRSDSDYPWLIHGFAKSSDLASSYIKRGCWIGIGIYMMHRQAWTKDLLQTIPVDRILLETDLDPESGKITADIRLLSDAYHFAAAEVGLSVEAFAKRIQTNLKTFLSCGLDQD